MYDPSANEWRIIPRGSGGYAIASGTGTIAEIPSWLDPDSAREVAALMASSRKMRDALRNIVANAVVTHDPERGGMTDVYSIPLDDIDAAKTALSDADPEKVK